MIGTAKLTAFIASARPDRAKQFYSRTLGLRLVSEDQFAIVFDCAGVQLRIQKVDTFQPHAFTAIGWLVPSIRRAVSAFSKRGIAFERYGFLEQDDQGVWQAPSWAKVAWFKDPDGNLLSLTEAAPPEQRPQPTKRSRPVKARAGKPARRSVKTRPSAVKGRRPAVARKRR